MEKGIEIEEIKEIEIKLIKQIPKQLGDNTIRKLITSKKYMNHILRHRRYCA